jgi:quercetin dioxygenase-like cupin family protein
MRRTPRLTPFALAATLTAGLLINTATSADAPEAEGDAPITEEAPARPAVPTVPLARVHEEPIVLAPDDMEWREGPASLPPGAQMALMEGDPEAQDRLFIVQLRLPAGYHVPPHVHGADERVTVLSGTLRVGHGENPAREDAQELAAGGYFVMPVGHPHAVWAEEETVVQLTVISPWVIEYVNPEDDPRRAAAR